MQECSLLAGELAGVLFLGTIDYHLKLNCVSDTRSNDCDAFMPDVNFPKIMMQGPADSLQPAGTRGVDWHVGGGGLGVGAGQQARPRRHDSPPDQCHSAARLQRGRLGAEGVLDQAAGQAAAAARARSHRRGRA